MRRLIVPIFYLCAMFLLGCAPTSIPVLLQGKNDVDIEKKWEKYGAYYQVDELFVEVSQANSLGSITPMTKYIINKKLKILTSDGTKFGTVEVPVYGATTTVFSLKHWDANGKLVDFPVAPVLSGYLNKGKIVFPNVMPGSVLEIHIEFNTQQSLFTLEHWFSGPLPVFKGRFTLSYLDQLEYDFKAYGPIKACITDRSDDAKSLTYQSWEIKEALPRSKLDFQDDIDITEPRLSVAMRKLNFLEIFQSWNSVSEDYEKYTMKESFLHRTTKLKKLIDSLQENKTTDFEKASAAFAWVQKNILYKQSMAKSIDPDKVIVSGQGNMWEIAVVLREMFEHLGLESDVLVSRPRSYGGFDASFISPIQLAVTMVSVKIGKVAYIAFPWSPGAALGEYPLDYFGLEALSLHDQAIVPVPAFTGTRAFYHTDIRIDPEAENAKTDMTLESGGYLAFVVRNSLNNQSSKDIEESYQNNLTRLGRSNALLKCDVQGIENAGRPLKVNLTFSNPNQIIMHKGEIEMRLSHIFLNFFSSYDTTRSSGFKNHLDVDYSETVHIPKVPGKTLIPSIKCKEISNPLFHLTCLTEETPQEFVFKRLVTVFRKSFNASEIFALAGDIQDLNQIRESSLKWTSQMDPNPKVLPTRKK